MTSKAHRDRRGLNKRIENLGVDAGGLAAELDEAIERATNLLGAESSAVLALQAARTDLARAQERIGALALAGI